MCKEFLYFKIKSVSLHPVSDSLAQLVEHDTLNVGVQGSIPWRVTRSGDGLSGSAFLLYGASLFRLFQRIIFRNFKAMAAKTVRRVLTFKLQCNEKSVFDYFVLGIDFMQRK